MYRLLFLDVPHSPMLFSLSCSSSTCCLPDGNREPSEDGSEGAFFHAVPSEFPFFAFALRPFPTPTVPPTVRPSVRSSASGPPFLRCFVRSVLPPQSVGWTRESWCFPALLFSFLLMILLRPFLSTFPLVPHPVRPSLLPSLLSPTVRPFARPPAHFSPPFHLFISTVPLLLLLRLLLPAFSRDHLLSSPFGRLLGRSASVLLSIFRSVAGAYTVRSDRGRLGRGCNKLNAGSRKEGKRRREEQTNKPPKRGSRGMRKGR